MDRVNQNGSKTSTQSSLNLTARAPFSPPPESRERSRSWSPQNHSHPGGAAQVPCAKKGLESHIVIFPLKKGEDDQKNEA